MKAQFITKINTIEQGCKVTMNQNNSSGPNDDQIVELETRITYLEDTVDSLNSELSELSQQFQLAKAALQNIYAKLEQFQAGQSEINSNADEPPPPHY